METVELLSKLDSDEHIISVEVNEEDLKDIKLKNVIYEDVKEYVLKKHGLKVSNLYIAQANRKCGIILKILSKTN